MAKEKAMLEKFRTLEVNDIIFIKGVITSTKMKKKSFCTCIDPETNNPTENLSLGNLLYVTPLYINKVKSYGEDEASAIQDVIENREISNQAYVIGTLIQDPKLWTTKKGTQITQYPIAINRKFLIRSDDPSIKTDWPVVKSYGEQARNDKVFLQYQANVFIDGFLQARAVTRKTKCKCCGKIYEWTDHAMEIIPYAVEYLTGQKTTEEIEEEHRKSIEDLKQELFNSKHKDELEDELKSSDVE